MQVECFACKTRYRVSDDCIPTGKAVKMTCKTCKSPIVIDSRQQPSGEEPPRPDDPTALKKRIVLSIKDLLLVPQVVLEIQNQLSKTNVNMQQVARMIETDPGIASKVLRVANSAYYGASGKRSTITQACVILGLKGLSEVVILAGTEEVLSGKFPGYGYDAGDLWKHSLAVAYGSKILAITKAIHWHRNPAGSDGNLLAYILHMADHLALMGGIGYDDDDILNEVQKETLSILEPKQSDQSEILLKIIESVNRVGARR